MPVAKRSARCFSQTVYFAFSLHGSADSLCTDLLSYIRKEKPVEVAISSCRILALLQISLALGFLSIFSLFSPDTSVTYDIAYPVLLQRLRSSKSVPLLIECFRTASIILFVCDARDEDVLDLLSLLSDRISSSSTFLLSPPPHRPATPPSPRPPSTCGCSSPRRVRATKSSPRSLRPIPAVLSLLAWSRGCRRNCRSRAWQSGLPPPNASRFFASCTSL